MNARPILDQRHYTILTIGFFIFVIYGSLVPLHFEAVPWDIGHAKFMARMHRGVNFDMRSDWAANVLLFIPLGFFMMAMTNVDRPRPWWGLAFIPFFTLLSGAIEFAQIWFPPRDTNVNDIIAETIGGIIGVLGWFICGQLLTNRFREFMSAFGPGDWSVRVLPAYLFFLIFTHGMPFDLTMSPGLVWTKCKRNLDATEIQAGYAMADFVPPKVQVPEKTLMSFAYFVPVGGLLAFLPGRRWHSRMTWFYVLLAGLFISATIEGLQLIVMSCSAFASDILVAAVAIFLGWKIATWRRPISRLVWIAAGLLWAVALTTVSWLPLQWQTERLADFWGQLEWMPFREYIDTNYLNGMNKIVHRCVAYVPVGFLINRGLAGRSLILAVLGGLLGVCVEAGQVVFTDHLASITDVILGSLGAWCGAVVANRAPKNAPSAWQSPAKADIRPIRLL